jgi:hypothetical protein
VSERFMVECPVKNRPEITIAQHLLGSAPFTACWSLLRVPTRFLAIYSSLRTLEPKTSKAFPSRWEPGRRCGKVTTAAPALLPAAVVRRRGRPQAGSAVLHRPRRQRAGAGLPLFRGGGGGTTCGGQAAHPRRGAAHRGEHRQAAGHSKLALVRSLLRRGCALRGHS